MEASMLIDLLNKERDYHSKHPFDVAVKFLYALGGSLAAVVSSLYFTEKADYVKIILIYSIPWLGWLVLFLFSLAIFFIFWGLNEHTQLHTQQRKRIEVALNDILLNYNTFNFDAFWEKHKEQNLELRKKRLRHPTPLITLEPDIRSHWRYHDRKIELGIILLVTVYTVLIIAACLV